MQQRQSPPRKATSPREAGFYIPSLDGIRAAAFSIVFLAHAGLGDRIPGGFGVTIFFFLSGYLITTLLRMEYDSTGNISLKQFYMRRCLRILPPFYLVLGIASSLTLLGVLKGSLLPPAIAAQCFHLSNYYMIHHGATGIPPGAGVYWSLAVEEHFYLLFPLTYLLLRRRLPSPRAQMLVLLGVCAAVLAWRCVLVFGLHAVDTRTYIATDTRIDSILFGRILAVYGNPIFNPVPISEHRTKRFWFPVGCCMLLITFVIRSPQFQQTFRYSLQGLALLPVFIAAIRYPEWGAFRLLNFRWIKFVGVLTYSLYLIHQVVLYAIAQDAAIPPDVRGLLAFIISAALAAIIYYGVDKPCARLRKRLSSRKAESLLREDQGGAFAVVPFNPPQAAVQSGTLDKEAT